jgi:hypothetical protein
MERDLVYVIPGETWDTSPSWPLEKYIESRTPWR